jgi:light-regulated signal transduction histidine kinase (bacteriophytochrome)
MDGFKQRPNLIPMFLLLGIGLVGLVWVSVYLGFQSAGDNEPPRHLLFLFGIGGSLLAIGGTALLVWQLATQQRIEKRLLARENDLIAARENLERTNDELRNFARVIAHDLQEPLRAIISYTQLMKLRYGGKLDEDADEFIGYLVSGAANMKARLMDLLDYTLIDQHSLKVEAVNLMEIMRDAETYYAREISQANASIQISDLPAVKSSRKRMLLLFEHLLANSLEYREPKRPLEIRITAKDKGDGYAEFAFADNGIGIEPQYFERIFVIFQRLHTISDHGGTGVGLAICKKIVEQLGGEIGVESVFGQGTTFRFTLPLA